MFHPQGPTFLELARQALSSTERGYDLLAPKFNFTPYRTPDLLLDRFIEQIRTYGPFGSILDLCCGTGAGMQATIDLCTHRMVGLDFSQGMLEVAKRELEHADQIDVEWVQGNALAPPFEDEFDLIVSFGAFGHILPKDEPQFVKGIHKALRSGGRFAFVTSEMPSPLGATYWLSRGFNAAMHVRNFLIRPAFVMFYLTFLWPMIGELLKQEGFSVEAFELFPNDPKRSIHKVVVAQKN